jgi:hypothetical protein
MTERKHQANIANAQLSTGPRTPEGKRRSSLVARRHQLTSKVYIAPPEEAEAFDAHCRAYRESLAPVGIVESDLVQEIAENRWRLKRARAIENAIFAQGHNQHADAFNSGHPQVDSALAEAETWLDRAPSFALLTTYENRIRRSIEKNTTQLEALQDARKAAYRQAQEEAIRLQQSAESAGETYDPAADFLPASAHGGFVYSSAEIARLSARRERLSRSLHLAKTA